MSAPVPASRPLRHWDLFCRVIDNHGDLGVCWRLAAQLAQRGQPVRLWVDDPAGLSWMAPQGAAGVTVRPWLAADHDQAPGRGVDDAPGAAVIEAFGCDLPESFLARMAECQPAPVWLNLEYLSAEAYVERSHRLTSPQWQGPAAGLTKWFWYPGFTPRTGGLLRDEPALAHLQAAASGHPGIDAALWARATGGWSERPAAGTRLALLFCYDHPATPGSLEAFAQAGEAWCLLVTPGQSRAAAERWWRNRPATPADEALFPAGRPRTLGALTLVPLQHLAQTDFDALLAECDLNIVRGEDSFVRAHWAGRPFIWQIYVQDDGAQHAKLAAWLDRWTEGAPADIASLMRQGHLAWNGLPSVWSARSAWTEPAADAAEPAPDPAAHVRVSEVDQAAWRRWLVPAAADAHGDLGRLGAWSRQQAGRWARIQPDLVSQLLAFVAEQGV